MITTTLASTLAPLTITLPAPSIAPSAPTRRACEAACLFGLSLEPDPARTHHSAAQSLALDLPPGSVTLITGPSGAGKSRLLSAITTSLRARNHRVINPATLKLRAAPAIDLIRAPLDHALHLLARAGLAEATCFIRRPSELSEGQRLRLRLALALRAAETSASLSAPHPILACDEFAAPLDRATAFSVAQLLARHIRAHPCAAAILATSHDDLTLPLAPDTTIHVSLTGALTITRNNNRITAPDDNDLIIEPAPRFSSTTPAPDDYATLAHLHYRAGAPVSIARTLLARCARTNQLAGALVVSMPTLNGAWRSIAWPGDYDTKDKRENTRRLNAEVRRISRVVVDPRHRGRGVASRLVSSYLTNPLTPRTEALAAMGRWRNFFQTAGMTPHPLPPNPADTRLLSILENAGVERWRLATPRAAFHRARNALSEQTLTTELKRWQSSGRAARTRHPESPQQTFTRAAQRLATTPIAYTHSLSSSFSPGGTALRAVSSPGDTTIPPASPSPGGTGVPPVSPRSGEPHPTPHTP